MVVEVLERIRPAGRHRDQPRRGAHGFTAEDDEPMSSLQPAERAIHARRCGGRRLRPPPSSPGIGRWRPTAWWRSTARTGGARILGLRMSRDYVVRTFRVYGEQHVGGRHRRPAQGRSAGARCISRTRPMPSCSTRAAGPRARRRTGSPGTSASSKRWKDARTRARQIVVAGCLAQKDHTSYARGPLRGRRARHPQRAPRRGAHRAARRSGRARRSWKRPSDGAPSLRAAARREKGTARGSRSRSVATTRPRSARPAVRRREIVGLRRSRRRGGRLAGDGVTEVTLLGQT